MEMYDEDFVIKKILQNWKLRAMVLGKGDVRCFLSLLSQS